MKILKVDTEKRRLGDYGETEAAKLLKKKGYRILERNYAPEDGEIDIIAQKDGVTAFIEVKTRHTSDMRVAKIEPRPASSVTPAKQRIIINTAKIFLASHRDTRVRFDIIEVYVTGEDKRWQVQEIKHLEGAFDRDSARPKTFYS